MLTPLATKLKDLEDEADLHLTPGRADASIDEANRLVGDHNNWLEQAGAALDQEKQQVEKSLSKVRTLEAEVDHSSEALAHSTCDPRVPESVERYNRQVEAHNELIGRHAPLNTAFKEKQAAFNLRVEQFNEEVARRSREVQLASQTARESVEAHNQWRSDGGPAQLSAASCGVRLHLARQARRNPARAAELSELRERSERLRQRLAEWSRREQASTPEGLLLTECVLSNAAGTEGMKVMMVVDNASTSTVVSPDIVEILDLGEYVGPKVELHLPDALRIKAPSLLLPRVAAGLQEAEWVKGVVLKESMPGVDGSLGLSFLGRFAFRIEKEEPQRLVLDPPKRMANAEGYRVFISCGSTGRDLGRETHQLLEQHGLHAFFSPVSLAGIRSADSQRMTDEAVKEAEHLIVICSPPEKVASPWADAEWRLFAGQATQNHKRGNIVNVIAKGADTEAIPTGLRDYPSMLVELDGWKEELLRILR
jgi:hypothetical protein